jgi:hypothetical protein
MCGSSESPLRIITTLLPLPPRALSSNGSYGHWATHSKAVKRYREDCRLLAAAARGELYTRFTPMEHARLSMRWVYCRTQGKDVYCPIDVGNAIYAAKPLIDSLIAAGIIAGDSADHLELGPVEIERHRGHGAGQCADVAGITVTVEELP